MSVHKRLAIVAFLGLSATAFGMEPTPGTQPQGTRPGTGTPTQTLPQGQPGQNPGMMRHDKANLSDAETMGLLDAVHKMEIEQARFILEKSRNLNVKKYAQLMIDDHSRMATGDRDLAEDHQTPEVRAGEMADGGTQTDGMQTDPTAGSQTHSMPGSHTQAGVDSNARQEIVDAGREKLAALKAASGAELDRLYVQSAIDGHQKVLDIIDGKLVATAQSPDVRAQLLEMRPAIRQHLDDAQRLKTTLATSTVPTGSM